MDEHAPPGTALLAYASAAAAVVAIAIIAAFGEPAGGNPPSASGTPAAASSEDPRTVPPTARSSGRVTAVPTGFPLDHALPPSEGEPPAGGVVDLAFCGVPVLPLTGIVDRVTAGASGPEYGELRDLRLFDSAGRAKAFVADFARLVDACPRQEVGGTLWRHEVRRQEGEAGRRLTVVQTFEQDGRVPPGANWWEVFRSGNVVLVTATGGEWRPGPVLEAAVTDHVRSLEPLLDALCAFSPSGRRQPVDPRSWVSGPEESPASAGRSRTASCRP